MLQPQQQQQLDQAVRTYSTAKKHDQAIAVARQALAANPRDPFCHFTLARALANADQRDQALYHADQAATIDVTNPTYAYFAGWLYHEFHLYEFALPLLERSVAIQPRAPRSRLELARCYDSILRPEKASEHYRVALSLEESGNEREFFKLLLAQTLARSNQVDEAKELFEQIHRSKGKYSFEAARELAYLSKEGPDSSLGKYLSRFLTQKNIEPLHKATALLALGRLHNNVKQYDRAFNCWQASREIEKNQSPFLRDHPKLLDRARQTYTPQLFKALADRGSQTDAVVVICGMPRSGTTLTEQIVASHSKASGAGEVARWSPLEEEFLTRHAGKDLAHYLSVEDQHEELRTRGDELLRILQVMSGASTPHIVEKTPHSFAALGYIKLCCPRAKFIHIRRHPLDAFISTYQNQFNKSHGYAFDQVEYAREYTWHLLMMEIWKDCFPDSILSVKYEDLAREPEVNARKIIEFIGLEWEDQCLEFYRGNKAVRTFSTSQVRNPVYDSSIGRWKNYRKHLGPIMEHLSKGGIDWESDW